jgi:hypothetical protein
MTRVSSNFEDNIKWSGAKPKWMLLYTFDKQCHAWITITKSYKIGIQMDVTTPLYQSTISSMHKFLEDKLTILHSDVINVIEQEISGVNMRDDNTSTYVIPVFTPDKSTLSSVIFKTNVSYPPISVHTYFSSNHANYDIFQDKNKKNDIVFYKDTRSNVKTDYDDIVNYYNWLQRNGDLHGYLFLSERQRRVLPVIFKDGGKGFTPVLYPKLLGAVYTYNTNFYSAVTFYKIKGSMLRNLLLEITSIQKHLVSEGGGAIENSHLSKVFPQYTNMKTENIVLTKINTIQLQTGVTYNPHDLQDVPVLILKREEFVKILYSPENKRYMKRFIPITGSMNTRNTMYTISMYVYDSLNEHLDNPGNDKLLFHKNKIGNYGLYNSMYLSRYENTRCKVILENVTVTPEIVASILWNGYKIRSSDWGNEMGEIVLSYKRQRVLYKATRIFLTNSEQLTPEESGVLQQWMKINNHTPESYWKNTTFFWVNPHAYIALDKNGEWRYVIARVVRKLSVYYPLVVLYIVLSIHIKYLSSDDDLHDDERVLYNDHATQRLITHVKSMVVSTEGIKNVLRNVLLLIKCSVHAGVYNRYTNMDDLTKFNTLLSEYGIKKEEYKFDVPVEETITNIIKYISDNKKDFMTEFSYSKKRVRLLDTLETNSVFHKLLSYKENDSTADGVMFDLLYHDFIGFLKYYKNNPYPQPPLRYAIFSVKSTSDRSETDIISRFNTLSIPILHNPSRVIRGNQSYQVLKTMTTKHPFRLHEIAKSKHRALHNVLYSKRDSSDTDKYYAVPTELSKCPILDVVLYHVYKIKSNSKNRDTFISRILAKKGIDDILMTINGGYFHSVVSDTLVSILTANIRMDNVIADHLAWSLLSIPGMVTNDVTYDIFYFKETDGNLDLILNPFYHPDTYDELHTPILVLETEHGGVFTIIKTKDGKNWGNPLPTKLKTCLYRWLHGTTNIDGAYPKNQSYSQYLNSFPPRYYKYTVKTIQKKLDKTYGDITKITDSRMVVTHIIIKLKKKNMMIPVFPHVCYNTDWEKISIGSTKKPTFKAALLYLRVMCKCGFNMYTPASFIIDSNANIIGIVCEHNLVLPCIPYEYNTNEHKLPIQTNHIERELMNTYMEADTNTTSDIPSERFREYYYNKALYHISTTPCTIHHFDFTSDQVDRISKCLSFSECDDKTQSQGVYSHDEMDNEYTNRYEIGRAHV